MRLYGSEINFMLFCDKYNLLRMLEKKCHSLHYLETESRVRMLMLAEFVMFIIAFVHDAFIFRGDLICKYI